MMSAQGYDVVVIGGGAAGCVVAAPFAEQCSRSVLLLEAGPDRRADVLRICRTVGRSIASSLNRDTSLGRTGGEEVKPVRRKRLLGGTSWLTRFTPRGSRADYDGRAGLGLTGWGWEDVLPHFVKLENDVDFGDRPWHGDEGPIPSSRQLDEEPTDVALLAREAETRGVHKPILLKIVRSGR
jgi:choline dehydrogenase